MQLTAFRAAADAERYPDMTPAAAQHTHDAHDAWGRQLSLMCRAALRTSGPMIILPAALLALSPRSSRFLHAGLTRHLVVREHGEYVWLRFEELGHVVKRETQLR